MRRPISIARRFERLYIPEPNTGCWLWIGALKGNGYGNFMTNGKRRDCAHRFSWSLHRGEIPEGMQIHHKCNVISCVNPDHLEVVSPQANLYYRVAGPFAPRRRHRRIHKIIDLLPIGELEAIQAYISRRMTQNN